MGALTSLVQAAGLWSYALIFTLTAAETSAFVGLLLPSETVILFAAALSAHGTLNPLLLTAAVVTGGIIGDSSGYALGRLLGKRVDARQRGHRIRPGGRIDRAGGYLRERGGPAVFTGRFIGFVRSFVPFAAGAAKMPYRRFLGFSASASLAWGLGNVALGYFLGASAQRLLHTIGLAGVAALAGVLVVAVLVLWWRSRKRARTAQRTPVRAPTARQGEPPSPLHPTDPAPAGRAVTTHGTATDTKPTPRTHPGD
ncbi:DedA family protein [Kitasatospora kifunensis]|uniref:Membrane protein DedA with SNARE-associated domain n=1 Tax=Kitasatospora kifunensis TaxID=58351 RepID=A0A7W7VYZ0_KITKI|nr:DedA family protein [Kitasatospora kifunensis]MBB4927150.1 membrane protein DedA with SNARE-associated domain [Kitasatospora kifunensis]